MTASNSRNSSSLEWGLGSTEQTHHERCTISPEGMKPTRPEEEWEKVRHGAKITSEQLHMSVSRKAFFSFIFTDLRDSFSTFCSFYPYAVGNFHYDIQNVYIVLYHQRFSVLTSHQLCDVQHYFNFHTKWVKLHESMKLWFSPVETGLDFPGGCWYYFQSLFFAQNYMHWCCQMH